MAANNPVWGQPTHGDGTMNQTEGERMVSVRDAIVVALILIGCVTTAVGAGILWGTGGAFLVVGLLMLVVGISLGIEIKR